MKNPFGEKISDGCKWEESCLCRHDKPIYCLMCKWYFPIDSGYGHCKVLPTHVQVGWCRDICSLYSKGVK